MEPSIKLGSTVKVKPMGSHVIHRGDIVMFDAPDAQPSFKILRRVVGLPGDTVETQFLHVYVNGSQLAEPYLAADTRTIPEISKTTVPPGRFFLLGDNRENSRDSRFFGAVSQAELEGFVVK